MHLIWHFGYGIWEPERYKSNPAWSKVWNTLSHGPKLNELQVDLDAYLGTTISPFVEAQVFEPLMAVAVSSKFVVNVSWPRSPETPANVKLPFRLEKLANNLDLVINDHYYDPTDV